MEVLRPPTPEARQTKLISYFAIDDKEIFSRGIEGVELTERDKDFFLLGAPSPEAPISDQAVYLKWMLQLKSRCTNVVFNKLKDHLDYAFVSEPCKEYITGKWKQSMRTGDKSQAQTFLEEISKNPETNGGLYDLSTAYEVEQTLLFIATQENLAYLKVAGKTGILEVAGEYGITSPEADLLGRWRNALADKGGFV